MSKRDQRITDILAVAKQTLDITQGLLNLDPVPGLDSAASVLSGLIGIILVAEGNQGIQEDIAKHLRALALIIKEMAMKIDYITLSRLKKSPELWPQQEGEERELYEMTLKDLPHVNANYSSASNLGSLEGTRTAMLDEQKYAERERPLSPLPQTAP